MAWKDGFVIEHSEGPEKPKRTRITCNKCVNCDKDGFCRAHAVKISEIGSDSWRHCSSFKLAKQFDDEKHRKIVETERPVRKKKRKSKHVCKPYIMERLDRGGKSTSAMPSAE